ncbi:MAG: hypothetical protein KFB93_07705 [Simkaniaceae bacterium]|jgi:hypothetical protein|nr:MAG: hypothetical protein KFB93_07705 [Simkaniaceae bacterium]
MAATAAGNFALKQLGLEWVVAQNRMGHIAYMAASTALSRPLYYLVEESSKGMFPEKPAEEETPSFLSNMGIKPIKSMDDLIEKIFWVAVSLALFIPVTILAKEAVIYMGYQHLPMVTTPLVTLLQEEVMDTLIFETLSLILCLSLDSSPLMS